MAFLFFNRKANKNAKSRPEIARDYYNTTTDLGGVSGTAFACIDRIASEFASLNFAIYDERTKQKTKRHSLYSVIKQPNAEDRHYNFFYQSAVDYFNGGCYWLKSMYDGEVVSLFRLSPNQVKLTRDHNNRRVYNYNGAQFSDDKIVFIPSRYDYSTLYGGHSIFSAAVQTFDTAKSVETFTQSAFNNGVVGNRLVIDVSKAFPDLTSEQAEAIKTSFQNEYSGLKNAGRPLLKKAGIEYDELKGTTATENQAAELSKNREFQEKEIAKIFGVPMDLLNGSMNGSNIENTFTMFAEFAIRPLATMFQEAINSMLDEDKYYFEFDYNGIQKVSLTTRIDAEIKQVENGLLSLDEARALENRSPLAEAGDTHFMPANVMPWNDEIKNAYMAKQKLAVKEADEKGTDADTSTNEGVLNSQHSPNGDDKQ